MTLLWFNGMVKPLTSIVLCVCVYMPHKFFAPFERLAFKSFPEMNELSSELVEVALFSLWISSLHIYSGPMLAKMIRSCHFHLFFFIFFPPFQVVVGSHSCYRTLSFPATLVVLSAINCIECMKIMTRNKQFQFGFYAARLILVQRANCSFLLLFRANENVRRFALRFVACAHLSFNAIVSVRLGTCIASVRSFHFTVTETYDNPQSHITCLPCDAGPRLYFSFVLACVTMPRSPQFPPPTKTNDSPSSAIETNEENGSFVNIVKLVQMSKMEWWNLSVSDYFGP